ncbi:MAG TPA: glycosyltransferase [Anaerolineales bacterium]|nr:glycosyltransferase [Anaerolineales bacterium]
MNSKTPAITYIIGTYPGLTTTFIDREVMALRGMGVHVQILSIRQPWTKLSAEQEALRKDVTYLLPVKWLPLIISHLSYALTKPRRFFSSLAYLLTRPHPSLRARLMTLIHFIEGVYAAYMLRRAPGQHLHAHFIDRAATVALVASRLLGIPYSVTAHASDIYVSPVLLKEKLASAKFVSTCTAYNRNYLSQFGKDLFNHKLLCIYHGLELERYVYEPRTNSARPVILSVGQLQERKGLSYLVEACGLLRDRGIQFECRIVGEGPLRASLQDQIQRLGLENFVRLLGALPHEKVIAQYQEATVFTLPAILGKDGDRDGIPNVILEALSMGLPVVSTSHSGIPEVIEEGVNGLLVPPEDTEMLASALEQLICNAEMRNAFGNAGRQIVADRFNPEKNVRRLLEAFVA